MYLNSTGFPDNMAFGEFRQRFEGLLSPNNKPTKDLPEKQAILHILDNLDIDKLNYRVGLSQVTIVTFVCMFRLVSEKPRSIDRISV